MSKYTELFGPGAGENEGFDALGAEILSEAAQSLGRAGERLAFALTQFHKCAPESPAYPTVLKAAADACWAYVVQRELLGLHHQEMIKTSYQVPSQVWDAMGRIAKDKI